MGPRWLLAGKLAFHHAEAAALHIARKTPPADHSGVPDELHVPWRLRFDNATAATLRYAPTSGAIQTYGDVGFALDFGARAWQLQLHRLQTRWGRLEGDGSIDDGRTRLAMKGNSVAAMLGSADGNLVLAMNGGSMSDLVLRLANLDIANSLIALARGNPAIPPGVASGAFGTGGARRRGHCARDRRHATGRHSSVHAKGQAAKRRLRAADSRCQPVHSRRAAGAPGGDGGCRQERAGRAIGRAVSDQKP